MWVSVGRAFQATGKGNAKDLSRKTEHIDGDTGKWELECMFKGQQGGSVTGGV